MITYQEMLPLLLKHVEAITSRGSIPCLANHVPWTAALLCCTPFLPYALICLSSLCMDL